MLLRRLKEYSDRLDLPPVLYTEGPLRYIVELDGQGRFLGLTDNADPSSPRTRRGQRRLLPQIQRSSGIRALLLADKADYTLGYGGDESARARNCHQTYLELVDRCAAATEDPAVLAVQRFLQDQPLAQVNPGDSFDPSGIITFRVGEEYPIDHPAVQAFWASENAPDAGAAPVMQCLTCGNVRPVLERLQAKIKGIPGGQTAGTSIISANAEAFESYGLRASLIAPTCPDCGERFTKGLNDLLSREGHSVRIRGGAFVYWTKEELGLDIFATFNDPQPGDVQALLDSARRGRWTPGVDDNAFYALSLSASGGRAVVRDWLDTTVGEVKRHLASWFQRQHIEAWSEGEARFYGLRALAYATVREPADLPVTTPRALQRAAFTGSPLPWDILYQAVRRNRAAQGVNRPRAALIKLVLLSQTGDSQEEFMVALDTENTTPAYLCGRLLAVLEDAQRAALPNVNATVVDRFYGTASTAPQSVFSRLLKGVRPHLSKLERDNRGAYHAIQGRLEEIIGKLTAKDNFPKTLTLEQQGLFSLGYYHQRAHGRSQAREAAERRRGGDAAGGVGNDTGDAA